MDKNIAVLELVNRIDNVSQETMKALELQLKMTLYSDITVLVVSIIVIMYLKSKFKNYDADDFIYPLLWLGIVILIIVSVFDIGQIILNPDYRMIKLLIN
jgi:hypothetical protein